MRFCKFPAACVLAAAILVTACHSGKQTASGPGSGAAESALPVYRASADKDFDLIHTRLDVSFDWQKHYLNGVAEITLKPHFYPSSVLLLDARGMIINKVARIAGTAHEPLSYRYAGDSLIISLDRTYSRNDTLKVLVDYVARPDELPKGGSHAITEDKGLYFINADGSEEGKPRQVWTQGETQASSAWFPTIDRPNQKSTQEIYITVDTMFVTLSNGKLISSVTNQRNGTRTDYWRQDLPHAPYLFMMAVGEFAVVTDQWRGKEVSYYVEKPYEKYARNIFGNTPEMLEFFSKKMGVDYPWDKYSQIVVRDYVSGAMENTTATIFGEFMQQDSRTQLDNRTEDVVSHELFHHWFGDLVTCESWSNIALNESFATYGEYLWNEYKYGKDFADHLGNEDLISYLKEAKNKQVDLIRFEYNAQEDVFDRHSYQKGGRILHMLRAYTGDEAFFEALRVYLGRYRFRSAEAHDLRLVFEEVTGEDMNWFFNQWFFDKGHPQLRITHGWDAATSSATIKVEQLQDLKETPLYTLPVDIDIYTSKGVTRKRVTITKKEETIVLPADSKPYLVNFDARKALLCTKEEIKPQEEWVNQYHFAPLYMDRLEALKNMGEVKDADAAQHNALRQALSDPSPRIRQIAVSRTGELAVFDAAFTRNRLVELGTGDDDSGVRAEALAQAGKLFPAEPAVKEAMGNALGDSSYQVVATGGIFLMMTEPAVGYEKLKAFENSGDENLRDIAGGIYTEFGDDRQYDFMTARMQATSGDDRYYSNQEYGKFLERCSPAKAESGVDVLAGAAKNDKAWMNRLSAALALEAIARDYGKREADKPLLEGPADKAEKERREVMCAKVRNKAQGLLQTIYSTETDENLKKIYGTRSK